MRKPKKDRPDNLDYAKLNVLGAEVSNKIVDKWEQNQKENLAINFLKEKIRKAGKSKAPIHRM